MRSVDPAVQAYRDSGRPMVERHLVWIAPRSGTGDPATGFWTGSQDRSLIVTDPVTGSLVTRAYHAAGSLIEVSEVANPTGLDIHPFEMSLSPIDQAVEDALRLLDLRLAAIELHRVWFDYDTRAVLAPGQVWATGRIASATVVTPAESGQAAFQVTAAPMTRALTIANPALLSDDVQKTRSGDRFLRYIGPQGSREIRWGGT